MNTKARVVVVGGGVVGASVAYHLTLRGWSDVVVCEKNELTSGATWRAAGHVILYTLNRTVSLLNRYSLELYKRLQAQTGQDPGLHLCGNLRLASDPGRLAEFDRFMGIASLNDIDAVLLSAQQVGELWPLMRTDGLHGALYTAGDGHIAPADLTQALAAGARQRGARILRQTEVIGFERHDAGWLVRTNKGDIVCEHVVSCSGLHTHRTLGMVGLAAHAIPVRHQYVLTEPIPELVERKARGLPELAVMRDPDQSFYVRQEGVRLLCGAYESRARTMFAGGVPDGFTQDSLPEEFDVLVPYLESAMARVPTLERTGIQSCIAGVMPYSPDDLPITGPAPGLDNFWLAEGNPFGITLAGGIGWQLAHWIVDGAPTMDMLACDPRRFGGFATRRYVAIKTEEAYERTYLIPRPGEELPAARPLKTAPLHDLWAARGAQFGAAYGWEVPNWFSAPAAGDQHASASDETAAFAALGRECRQASTNVALHDRSTIAKFMLRGAGAQRALDAFACTALPAPGSTASGYALDARGHLQAAFVVVRESADQFLLLSATESECYLADLLARATRDMDDVRIDNLTTSLASLRLSGPRAGELLALASETAELVHWPDRTTRALTLGLAPAQLIRNAAHWDLLTGVEYLRHVFFALQDAGTASLPVYGAYAANSLRLERGEPAWGTELTAAYTMGEAGLGELVDVGKRFCGFEAVQTQRAGHPQHFLLRCAVDTAHAHPPVGDEPLRIRGGRIIGRTTSGGYGHLSGRAIAFAYASADGLGTAPGDFEILINGRWCAAQRL